VVTGADLVDLCTFKNAILLQSLCKLIQFQMNISVEIGQ
jgi:hypothetical protein